MLFDKAIGLISDKDLIGETRYIWQTHFYSEYVFIMEVLLVMAIAFFLLIYDSRKTGHKISSSSQIILFLLFSFAAMSFFMFRFLIFLLPLVYISTAIILETQFKYLFVGIYAVCMLFSMDVYLREPIMNDGIYDAISYLNEQNSTCLVGDWGKGHIYRYYFNGDVLLSAHPSSETIQAELDFMVYGNRTGCAIIWTQQDYLTLSYLLSRRNDTMQQKDYYIASFQETAKHFEHGNLLYWVKP